MVISLPGGYLPRMATYERTTTVAATPDALFAYLSDVENLPDYFVAMKSATATGAAEGESPAGSTEVHTVAEVGGKRREGDAWFRRDADTRSLSWGSEGSSDYRGELVVGEDGDGSTVTVSLHTDHGGDEDVEEGLATTLATIKAKVEGQGGANPS
jgi:uncharacterized protein YndB with AHSA1/START domain